MTKTPAAPTSAAAALGGTFRLRGSGLTVHRLGYGAMQLAGPGVWGPPKDPEAARTVLREALALGIDHIDTADFYGPHVTNRLIRDALAPYPERLVIVTKIGFRRGTDRSWHPAASKEELVRAIEDNLANLGRDAIDVVNLRCGGGHGVEEASIATPLAALVELQRRGLVRHIGLSNVSRAQVDEGLRLAEIVCVQNHYNLADREDDALVDDLAARGVAYVPYFPLGGFSPLQSGALDAVARRLEATPMQVALAWLLHRAPNILLIPGTSSVAHLRENVAAASLALPADALRELDRVGTKKKKR